jgi:hypothetical protein
LPFARQEKPSADFLHWLAKGTGSLGTPPSVVFEKSFVKIIITG